MDPTVELVDDDSGLSRVPFPPEGGLILGLGKEIRVWVLGDGPPRLARTRGAPENLDDRRDVGATRLDGTCAGDLDATLVLERHHSMHLKEIVIRRTSLDSRPRRGEVIPEI